MFNYGHVLNGSDIKSLITHFLNYQKYDVRMNNILVDVLPEFRELFSIKAVV